MDNLEVASGREWLETNGIGGYASSTIVGLNTRRYHGLLVAATKPPVGRMVLPTAAAGQLLESNPCRVRVAESLRNRDGLPAGPGLPQTGDLARSWRGLGDHAGGDA